MVCKMPTSIIIVPRYLDLFCCLQSSISLGCHLLTRLSTDNRDDMVLQTSPGLLITPTGIIVCEATAVYSIRNAGNSKCSIYTLPSHYVSWLGWPLVWQSLLRAEELHDVPPRTFPRENRLQDGQSQGAWSRREGMGRNIE